MKALHDHSSIQLWRLCFIFLSMVVRQTLAADDTTPNTTMSSILDSSYSPPLMYANFHECRHQIQKLAIPSKPPVLVDRQGNKLPAGTPVDHPDVVGVDDTTCYNYCGSNPEKPSWEFFSTQFSSWLLPFFALTAQFPYETGKSHQDIMSFFLIVGSPMFAGYTLALTFLSSRWLRAEVRQIFGQYEKSGRLVPRIVFQPLEDLPGNIERTLRYCQQEPLYIGDLGSRGLNRGTMEIHKHYWESLWEKVLEAKRPYTASFVSQILWVVVAFVFTMIDAFSNDNLGKNSTAFGLSIGLLWIWEIPVVFGWVVTGTIWRDEAPSSMIRELKERWKKDADVELQFLPASAHISPMASQEEDPVSGLRPVPTPNSGQVSQHQFQMPRPSLHPLTGWPLEEEPENVATGLKSNTLLWATAKGDSHQRGPMFAYARPFTWNYNSLTLLTAYARVYLPDHIPNNHWQGQVKLRIALASFLGFLLLWSTVGAAMVLNYNTPAKGLSCRSGGNLLYIIAAVLVWAFMVSAAWLTDQPATYTFESDPPTLDTTSPQTSTQHLFSPNASNSTTAPGIAPVHSSTNISHANSTSSSLLPTHANEPMQHASNADPNSSKLVLHGRRDRPLSNAAYRYKLAMVLRTFGKTLAILNAIWVVTHNFLEFLSVLDNCWCSTTQILKWIPGSKHVWLWEGLAEVKTYENVLRTWILVTVWACFACVGLMITNLGIIMKVKRESGE
ncbi:hypothetical protein BJ508DRAFT_411723 [Ascobolus immersus RN42]|uniref:Uncharacterized protein n=1 Tax=Ascobolus immersus RN42 TaxID=1160509 RepID=A0A3N4IHW6_ASCIM|nr:hypothetical protein BJ508DRAFT_411723 [Ascobolus immersus RN42]